MSGMTMHGVHSVIIWILLQTCTPVLCAALPFMFSKLSAASILNVCKVMLPGCTRDTCSANHLQKPTCSP